MRLINKVDTQGNRTGSIEKLAAHRKPGVLHEAFSIVVHDGQGSILIHQRALEKYHAGGLWTNTCCSHADYNEELDAAVQRRLREEMGFIVPLTKHYAFTYKADLGDLCEYEYDYVFTGITHPTEILVQPDPSEVAGWKWIALGELQADILNQPQHYTPWFRIMMSDQRLLNVLEKEK